MKLNYKIIRHGEARAVLNVDLTTIEYHIGTAIVISIHDINELFKICICQRGELFHSKFQNNWKNLWYSHIYKQTRMYMIK